MVIQKIFKVRKKFNMASFYKRRVVVCDMGIRASKAGSNVGKQGIGELEEVRKCPALPVRPLEATGSLFLIGVKARL